MRRSERDQLLRPGSTTQDIDWIKVAMIVHKARNLWTRISGNWRPAFKESHISTAIPRKIHQLWIAPQDHTGDIPSDVVYQTRRWQETHPDFEHRVWTIDEVAAAIPTPKSKRMMETINVCRFEAMRADVVRLYLVHEFGGFWSDLKVYPIRRWLDGHLDQKLVLIEHFKSEWIPNPAGVLLNSFFGAYRHNPFIEACLERAHMNIDNRLSTTLWDVASPQMYMDVYDEWLARAGCTPDGVVLPSSYVWGNVVELGGGSYNNNDRHWSVREQNESMYLDTDARAISTPGWRWRFLDR